MTTPNIGSREEWIEARTKLLDREKDLNCLRDELAEQRRQLPWVPVDKPYRFEGPHGELTLRDLFNDHNQLLVYHFMFGPDWDEGCPSCSFWADSFEGTLVHLAHRERQLRLRVPCAVPGPRRLQIPDGLDLPVVLLCTE